MLPYEVANCFTIDSAAFLSSHHGRSPSTMKSLVLLLLPKNKNDLPVTGSRMPPGTSFWQPSVIDSLGGLEC